MHIDLTVPERVLSLHRKDVRIPVDRVRSIKAVSDVMARVRGVRMPGTGLPGRMAIGTWTGQREGRTFHDLVVVPRPGPGVLLDVDGGEYDRVLLGCADPQAVIEELQR